MSETITVNETTYTVTVTPPTTQTVTVSTTDQSISVTEVAGDVVTITAPATQTVTITQNASTSTNITAYTTDDLAEGSTNLYHTTARASAAAPVQSLSMPLGYTITDSSGALTVSVSDATQIREDIGAHDAANLTTGDLAAARIANRSISDLSDVGVLDKTADNIMYTDGTRVLARQPSNWSLDDFTFDATFSPSTNATYDIGTPDARVAQVHGDLDGAVVFLAKNKSGGDLSVGDIVFISGATGDEKANVQLADADDAAKMPAFGMISTGGGNNNDVYVTTLGTVTGVDLPSGTYSVGDEVYVSATAGEFTLTPPTGETGLIQKIGKVMRVNPGASPNTGTLKIMGAGRSNAVPNLDQDKVFLGNASNQAASTALSAINLSKFNNDLVLSSTDYLSHPLDTSWKFFCDFFQVTPDLGSNDGNNQFWMMGGGSGVSPQDEVSSSARGQANHRLGSNNNRYAYWGAMILNDDNRADGDELLWEARVYFSDSTATTGTVAMGVVDRVNTLNRNDAPPNGGYSSFDYAALSFNLAETNARIVDKDTGAAGTATGVQQLTAMTNFVDNWFRIGVHCKFNNTDSDWDIDFYIDGTKVGSTVSMTFDESIVPYVGISVGTHTGNCALNIDWISYQGNIGQAISGRTTTLAIGDL